MDTQLIKQIFQVVCVVDDLDAVLENWKTMVEFNQASIKSGSADRDAQYLYKGKEIQCPLRYARFDLGGVDMMLVEPENKQGGDPYSDCLIEKGQGFHHLGIYTEDCDGLIKNFAQRGIQPVFEVKSAGSRGYLLYDLKEETGMTVAPYDHLFGPCGPRDGSGKTL